MATAALALLFSIPPEAGAATRLFILSGQSNMVGLNPDESFTPDVKAAFPGDEIIVVKEAGNGQPIRKWYRDWQLPPGMEKQRGANGVIYKRMMDQVTSALEGKAAPETITFVWMQGEADAKIGGEVYEESLKGLIKQLRDDLKRQDVMVVIGRISDYVDTENPRPHWDSIRKIQESIPKSDPLARWVDTDDLNGLNNGLHYGKDGYAKLGSRFAAAAIELIKSDVKAESTPQSQQPELTK